MPAIRVSTDLELHYLIDDFTDPWREADTVLLLHGNAESCKVWFGWAPHLARHFRVVRPDMRGFGDSTYMPRDYAWSIDGIIDDYLCLMRTLVHRTFPPRGRKGQRHGCTPLCRALSRARVQPDPADVGCFGGLAAYRLPDTRYHHSEMAKWGKVIKDAGIRAE